MIVFGHNSFAIKKITPEELRIASDESEGFSFEVRQRYFHFFWIPTFGIGKLWVMKNYADPDEMYEMSDDIKGLIEAKYGQIKSPWYTYIGAMIIGAGLIALSFA